jgi:pimeloyl-ACP methyl ester carboxylesterase
MPEVDPDRLFVYGHSVGGMHAALLAEQAPLRGVVVYGSTARRWSACLRDGLRRQLSLRGVADAEIEDALRDFDAGFPDERYERSPAFHRQLDATDLEAAWRHAHTDLLVLIGEHDWVVGAEEQRDLAGLVEGATVVELDGLDHAFSRHASRADSLREYARGAFDERLIEVPVRWMSSR